MKTANLIDQADDAARAKPDLALATEIQASVAKAPNAAVRKLLVWLMDRARTGGTLPFDKGVPVRRRIGKLAGVSNDARDSRLVAEAIDLWAPRFPQEQIRRAIDTRTTLPGVAEEGTNVPVEVLVAHLRGAAGKRHATARPRLILMHLIAVAEGDRTLPNFNGRVNIAQILRDAGLKGTTPGLNDLFAEWSGFFHLAGLHVRQIGGVAVEKRVCRIEVEKYIASLRKEGRRLWANQNGRVDVISYEAVAHETNMPPTSFGNNVVKRMLEAYKNECRIRDGDQGTGLGPRWPGLSEERRHEISLRRAELMTFVNRCAAQGISLPSMTGRKRSVDFDALVRLSGKPGENLSNDKLFKEAIWASGVKIGEPSREPATGSYTYDDLLEIVPDDRVAHLEGSSKRVIKSVTRRAIKTVRDHVAAQDGMSPGANRSVGNDFGRNEDDLLRLVDELKENDLCGTSPGQLLGAVRYVHEWIASKLTDDGLGATFHAVVANAVRRDPRHPSELAANAGISAAALNHWVAGKSLPNDMNVARIPALEAVLGLADGRISSLLTEEKIKEAPGRRRRLEKGMAAHASDDWRTMPEDEFLAMTDYIRTVLMRRNTASGEVSREAAARRVAGEARRAELGEPIVGISATMQAELDFLVDHMTKPMQVSLLRRGGRRWRQGSTAPMKLQSLLRFLRWQVSSPEDGGLGRNPSHLTMADAVHPPLVFAYIDHCARKYEDVTWEDKKRGAVITPAEIDFVTTCAALLQPKFGFVAQQHALSERIVPDARRLPAFAHIDGNGTSLADETEEEERWNDASISDIEIMPATFSGLDEQAFARACADAELRYRQTAGDLELIAESTRDPMEPIMPIIEHEAPCELLFEHLARAAERQPNKARETRQFHLHRRDVLSNLLLGITALRSGNMRAIRLDGPNPNLVYDAKVGKWLLQIHWNEFKNFRSSPLFGQKRRRQWYRRHLPDVFGLYELIEQYRKESRPWFLDNIPGSRRAPDELLLSSTGTPICGSEMWHNTFDFTAKHIAGNPYRGTGITGCQPFGPHAYRDIKATHILLHPLTQDAYLEAAFAIQSSPRMIVMHYGRVRSEVRNAIEDPRLFDIQKRVNALLRAR